MRLGMLLRFHSPRRSHVAPKNPSLITQAQKLSYHLFPMIKPKFEHLLWLLVLGLAVMIQGPRTYKNWKMEGMEAATASNLVDVQYGLTLTQTPPRVFVFWATWCQPCSLELLRIQNLIDKGKMDKDRIIAVSLDDSPDELRRIVQERKYTFPVVWDKNAALAQTYQVEVTPTLIAIGEKGRVVWATSGISPGLELRLLRLFAKN